MLDFYSFGHFQFFLIHFSFFGKTSWSHPQIFSNSWTTKIHSNYFRGNGSCYAKWFSADYVQPFRGNKNTIKITKKFNKSMFIEVAHVIHPKKSFSKLSIKQDIKWIDSCRLFKMCKLTSGDFNRKKDRSELKMTVQFFLVTSREKLNCRKRNRSFRET